MTVVPHTLQNESPTDELAMLLVGAEKSGKSWLAATAPGNVFFLDGDKRLAALRSHPNAKNIYGFTFSDPTSTSQTPTGMNEIFSTLGKLEQSPLLRDLHTNFANCGDKWVDTLVYDSIQSISAMARNYVLYNGGDDIRKQYVIGGRTYRVPRTFTAWGGEMEMVTGAILQGRSLMHCRKCAKSITYMEDPQTKIGKVFHTANPALDKDHPPDPKAMNVIVVFHECMEEDERSTDENPIYTGKIEVFPRRYRTLLIYFNEIWRLTRDTGRIPKIQIDPDGKFLKAATALGVEKIGVADISQVLRDAKSLKKT